MIALAINNSISLSTTLVFSGLWNIVTGFLFGIPLPVQPMKVVFFVPVVIRNVTDNLPGNSSGGYLSQVLNHRDHFRRLHHIWSRICVKCDRIAEMVF